MGGQKSKAVASSACRRRKKESPLLSPKGDPADDRRGQGQGQRVRLLGPAERSERRYIRNYDDLLLLEGDATGGGVRDGASSDAGGGGGCRDRGGGGGGGGGGGRGEAGRGEAGRGDRDGGNIADIDQTIDRYDYLIAFPHPRERGGGGGRRRRRQRDEEDSTEGSSKGSGYGQLGGGDEEEEGEREGGRGVDSDDEEEDNARITLAEVNDIWYSAVPGDEVCKMEANESLRREWEARFRTPSNDNEEVSISRSEWVRLAREVVVSTLFAKSGLQLKLSLSRQGDQVDPGQDFWSEEEIVEEQRIYGKDAANETLEKLFQAEKISPNDLAVFDDEALPNQWSRRVHALERIADRVGVTNRFPAYAEYTSEDRHRHLFETYPSIRGRTIFRAKDRLALTKGIISAFFDMGVLEARGIVDAVCALHDANRGEVITTEVLQKRWTLGFCREINDRIGAPMLSMQMMDDGYPVPWFMRPFCQPLDDIRGYFGEKMAFYFAWLGFYGWSLIIPAICGVGVEIYYLYAGTSFDEPGWKYSQVFGVVGIILWGAVYQELWEREQKLIAVKWGTAGFEEAEKDRPHFEGDKDSPGGGKRRSPVTNTAETYFPDYKRKIRQALGLVVVLLFVVGLLVLVVLVEFLEHYLEVDLGYSWASTATSVLASIQIQVLSFVYSWVVKRLNDFENYRTETAYENNLIFKTFLFQVFNNYSALAYTAFVETYVYECSSSCIEEVRVLLVSIFFVRFVMVGMEVFVPYVTSQWTIAKRKRRADKLAKQGDQNRTVSGEREGGSSEGTGGGRVEAEEEPMEAELRLPAYDGPFSDYSAIVLQYGYIMMFVSALPAVTFLAMVEVLVQLRTDSYKLVSLMRRPDPEMAEGVGMWSNLMNAMGLLAVLTNTAIICFTEGTLSGSSTEDKVLAWLVLEHVLLVMKVAVHIIIPDEAAALTIVKARQRFVVHKHLHGFVIDEGDGDLPGAGGEAQRRGNLDVVGLQLEGKQRDRQLSAGALAQMGRLRAELRDLTRSLKIVKEQLQSAYQHETFNEQAGIGETKHGLPLGCLNIKLIRLDGMEGDPQATTIVMSLRNSRQGDKTPPGPDLQASRPAERGSRNAGGGSAGGGGRGEACAVMVFSQVFVMAPIRSQDVELIFDVTQAKHGALPPRARDRKGASGGGAGGGSSRAAAPKRAGTCRVSLRELADQKEHDLPLTILKKVDNRWVPSTARLYVKVKFMYSKIVPLRNRIYALQDRKRTVEKEITLLHIGGGGGDKASV